MLLSRLRPPGPICLEISRKAEACSASKRAACRPCGFDYSLWHGYRCYEVFFFHTFTVVLELLPKNVLYVLYRRTEDQCLYRTIVFHLPRYEVSHSVWTPYYSSYLRHPGPNLDLDMCDILIPIQTEYETKRNQNNTTCRLCLDWMISKIE